jgi:hypothetical protein
MADAGRVLVVTSCTSLKAIGPGDAPVPAERLYLGEQHRRLMRGVEAFRAAGNGYEIDLQIVSAGHGIVAGKEPLSFYDNSFAGLGGKVIDKHAAQLGIPTAFEELLGRPYALALLLLGDDYMRAASLRPDTGLAGPTLAFCGSALRARLRGVPSLRAVPAGKRETHRFACGLVGLKGEIAGRLLSLLGERPELIGELLDPDLDVLDLLSASPYSSQFAA